MLHILTGAVSPTQWLLAEVVAQPKMLTLALNLPSSNDSVLLLASFCIALTVYREFNNINKLSLPCSISTALIRNNWEELVPVLFPELSLNIS